MVAAKSAKEVIGVELNPDAVRDAIKNAKRNQMKNIRFYQDDAGRFMEKMAAKGERQMSCLWTRQEAAVRSSL